MNKMLIEFSYRDPKDSLVFQMVVMFYIDQVL